MPNMLTDVVIAALNSKYIHSSLAPWCLLAGLHEEQPTIVAAVEEGTINEPIEILAERIARHRPKIIGFSCYIWNIRQTYQLMAQLKNQLDRCFMVLGGPEVSYRADEVLSQNDDVDFVLSGEGEHPFAALCAALLKNEPFAQVPGLSYRTDTGVVLGTPYISKGQPPSPYTPAYFKALGGRIAYLETTRGCPFSCAFCLSGRCGSVRFFDVERAKRDMLALAQSGVQTIKLVDRTFNADERRARELVTFIIARYGREIPMGVCFHFEIAGDLLSDRMIEIFSRVPAGAVQLEIGMQSFNEKTLSSVSRRTDTARLRRNIARLLEAQNIHVHIDLIAGLPYEDIESFARGFDIAYDLGAHMLQLGFLKLIPGCAMRERREQYPCVYDPEPPYEVQSTPWMSEADFARLKCIEDALDRLYNSGRFPKTLALLRTQYTPFCLFDMIKIDGTGQSLDAYCSALFERLSVFVDRTALREAMVQDRLASNPTGQLPDCLKIAEQNMKRYKRLLHLRFPVSAGVKRGMAVLYRTGQIVWADYDVPDPVSGRFELHYISVQALCKAD